MLGGQTSQTGRTSQTGNHASPDGGRFPRDPHRLAAGGYAWQRVATIDLSVMVEGAFLINFDLIRPEKHQQDRLVGRITAEDIFEEVVFTRPWVGEDD